MEEPMMIDITQIPNQKATDGNPIIIHVSRLNHFSSHQKCTSQQFFKMKNQKNRIPSTMVQSQMQTAHSFQHNHSITFSRPYIDLNRSIQREINVKQQAKILSIRQIKQICGQTTRGNTPRAEPPRKSHGISIVKQKKLKNDTKFAKIELGGCSVEKKLSKLKGKRIEISKDWYK